MKLRLWILIIYFFSGYAVWANQIWTVKKMSGEAMVQINSNWESLRTGSQIEVGQKIKTSKKSKLLLAYNDSKIWISSNTLLQLKAPTSKAEPNLLELVYGKLRTIINSQDSNILKYKLKEAVAGVRGTEFFASVDENKVTLCTLEGLVEANTEDGQNYLVDEGKGLFLVSGEPAKLAETSNFLIDNWVAETSFEEDSPVTVNNYLALRSSEDRKKNQLNENSLIYYGVEGWSYYCDMFNPDYQSSTNDKNLFCLRTYISPYIQYGKNDSIFFRPAVNQNQLNYKRPLDGHPSVSGVEHTQLTIAELYVQKIISDWTFKLGQQDVHWTDGILISRQEWSLDPTSHLALTATNSSWEFLFTKGYNYDDLKPLDGKTHIDIFGFKTLLPHNTGEFAFVHMNFGKALSGPSSVQFGHEISNYQYFSQQKWNNWDGKLSYVYQNQETQANSTGTKKDVSATMIDLELGYYLSLISNSRLSFRVIKSSKDFFTPFEDYYRLGAAGMTNQRGNLTQFRIKFQKDIGSDKSLYLENLSSSEVSSEGFFRQSSETRNNSYLANEWDLIYQQKWSAVLTTTFGLWLVHPGSIQPLADSNSWGVLVRANFNW